MNQIELSRKLGNMVRACAGCVIAISLVLTIPAATYSAYPSASQRRDFLSMKEIERLQEAQRIDLRISVLVTAADRRFAALGLRTPVRKSERDWGENPQGTREELLRDIDRIIMKAIDDVDYAATQESNSKFFRNGVVNLKKSCDEYEGYFRKLLDASDTDREKGVILSSLERCAQVVEAWARLDLPR
jgi:acyl-CoA reductase-like NAD-dependent aldehyde dehydrogenase